MAAYTNTKYEADDGSIHAIRLRAATAAVAGAAPTGAVDSDIKVKVTKTNREFGIRPRSITISQTKGEGEDTFKIYATIPILTETAFDAAANQLGATVNYNGETWTVVSRNAEDY
jgi:hypothetical protein